MKSVFVNLGFRDGLVWTVGPTQRCVFKYLWRGVVDVVSIFNDTYCTALQALHLCDSFVCFPRAYLLLKDVEVARVRFVCDK